MAQGHRVGRRAGPACLQRGSGRKNLEGLQIPEKTPETGLAYSQTYPPPRGGTGTAGGPGDIWARQQQVMLRACWAGGHHPPPSPLLPGGSLPV